MNLLQELQDRISAWMAGDASLDALFGWLGDNAEALAAVGNQLPALRALSGRAWNMLSMYQMGDATEEDVRAGLLAAGAIPPIVLMQLSTGTGSTNRMSAGGTLLVRATS